MTAEGLVLRKEYAEGMERQEGEQGRKNEPTPEGITTFTPAKEASAQPEVLEWRDPNYFSDLPSKKSSLSPSGRGTKSPRWEDDDFVDPLLSGEFSETVLSTQTPQTTGEVAASPDDWTIEETRIEMEMSEEEASDVEAFDVDAFL